MLNKRDVAIGIMRTQRRENALSDGPPLVIAPDVGALNARIEHCKPSLRDFEVEKNCLEGSVVEHRADFERERDRCDKLMAETLVLTKVAMSARENAARLAGELAARQVRPWWRRLVAANAKRRTAPTAESPAAVAGGLPSRHGHGRLPRGARSPLTGNSLDQARIRDLTVRRSQLRGRSG
jgi:hypothetical protein